MNEMHRVIADLREQQKNSNGNFIFREENEFGLEKALEVIPNNRDKGIRGIQKNLHKAVLAFSAGGVQEDDITSVIGRFEPGDAYPVTMGHTHKE